MKRILAIVGLTWKAAFRYRLFWIMTVLLIAAVIGLPMLLKDDGSAKGLVQILLTYTLGAISALLGFATLWLSCGTLARDVEECQMQMVAVKPIARWQVWMGKWLGILTLDAALLAMAGCAIFFLLQWRASRLPEAEQKVLRQEIFVARASAKQPPPDLRPRIDQALKGRVKIDTLTPNELYEVRKQIEGQILAGLTEVSPGRRRRWAVDLHTKSDKVKNAPLELRVKFQTADPNSQNQFPMVWIVGPQNSARQMALPVNLPQNSFQDIAVPAGLLDEKGVLWVDVYNPGDEALIFPLDEGFELLYPENTFGVNYIRGLAIIFCWLALLASIGLAAASFLSFPVAAFTSLALLVMGLSSGTISTVVEEGTITGYDAAKAGYGHTPADLIFVPIFRGALKIIKLVEGFSPIDFLSSGRSVTWGILAAAVGQIIFLLGGIFCVAGIIFFTRRELATAQGNNN